MTTTTESPTLAALYAACKLALNPHVSTVSVFRRRPPEYSHGRGAGFCVVGRHGRVFTTRTTGLDTFVFDTHLAAPRAMYHEWVVEITARWRRFRMGAYHDRVPVQRKARR
jgi:hypothetical protein